MIRHRKGEPWTSELRGYEVQPFKKKKQLRSPSDPESLRGANLEKLWSHLFSSRVKGNLGFDLTLMANNM